MVLEVIHNDVEITVAVKVGVNRSAGVGPKVGTAVRGNIIEAMCRLFVENISFKRVRQIRFSTVENVEIFLPIVIKIKEVRIPGPPAAIAAAVKKGVMLFLEAVLTAHQKHIILQHSHARGGPLADGDPGLRGWFDVLGCKAERCDVAHVDVLGAVAIDVRKAYTHSM